MGKYLSGYRSTNNLKTEKVGNQERRKQQQGQHEGEEKEWKDVQVIKVREEVTALSKPEESTAFINMNDKMKIS